MLEKIGIEMVDDARRWYKLYSIWFFAAISIMPDIYNLVAASGLFPPENTPAAIDRLIKMGCLLGAVFRLVKQKVATEQPAADPAAGETPPPPAGT